MKVISKYTVRNGGGSYTEGKEYDLVQEGRRVLIEQDDNGSKQCLDYCNLKDIVYNKHVTERFEILL